MWSAPGLRITSAPAFMRDATPDVRALYRRHVRGNSLLRNLGSGRFEDKTLEAHAGMGRWAWSSDALDFDSDGWDDLYIVNGDNSDQAHLSDTGALQIGRRDVWQAPSTQEDRQWPYQSGSQTRGCGKSFNEGLISSVRRTMRKLCLAGVVGAAAISVSAQHQSAKDLERKAKNQLGQVAVLCGTVVFFRCERATLTTMLVLLDDVSGKVAVAILPGLRKSLGTRVDDHYISQNVQLELLKGTKASTQLRPLTSRRWKCVVALGRCRTRLRLVRDLLAKTALSCPS